MVWDEEHYLITKKLESNDPLEVFVALVYYYRYFNLY